MDTIVITCMDPRLNGLLDREYLSENAREKYGRVEVWRNASGRLPPIEEILHARPRRVILVPHEDCLAKGFIFEGYNTPTSDDDTDPCAIIAQARRILSGMSRFSSREQFDAALNRDQEWALRGYLLGTEIGVEMRVVSKGELGPGGSAEDRVLFISDRPEMTSAELARMAQARMESCYVIQGPSVGGLAPDINLALKLGITNTVNLARSGTLNRRPGKLGP